MDPRAGRDGARPSPTRSPSRPGIPARSPTRSTRPPTLTAAGDRTCSRRCRPARPACSTGCRRRCTRSPPARATGRCGTSRWRHRVAALRDPGVPRPLVDEEFRTRDVAARFLARNWAGIYRLGDPPDYEPHPDSSVAAVAAREGRRPEEVALDWLLEDDGKALLFAPLGSYVDQDHEAIREMISHPGVDRRPVRRRRSLRPHLRRVVPHLPAHPLDPRPDPGRAPPAGARRAQADRRDGRGVRTDRPRHARAGARRPT